MSQPAPPQYSPDRKFYWDGERWAPAPPEPFMASLGGCFGWGCLVLLAAIVVVAVVGAIVSGLSPR